MNKIPLISLCIPTNGLTQFVFPVLDSIYSQNIEEALFEVVVADDGNNADFEQKMINFAKDHENLIYKKTTEQLFMNEIASYKLAHGLFIKFVNHRTCLVPGALQYLIDFVNKNINDKPFVYFNDGVSEDITKGTFTSYKTFDEFVCHLSYWSSWSTGMGFWKDDFDKITANQNYNELFPHTNILFSQRKRNCYIIDNKELLKEIPTDSSKKGKYDIFYAFAVEYLALLLDLQRTGDISITTFEKLKDNTKKFIFQLYRGFVFRKNPCSYDLSTFRESMLVFYSKKDIRYMTLRSINATVVGKIKYILHK